MTLKDMQIYKTIFGERYNDAAYITEVAVKYPFFSLALLRQLQLTSNTDLVYNSLASKTALHFNNPFLLKYRLEFDNPLTLLPTVTVKHPDSPAEQHQSDNEKPLFEPLYASDYFASQGIKLSEEMKGDDKLGRQLKSFTEWLKTMKKVHAIQKEETITIDSTVEKLAENSNREEEVLTESMAEVYENQGKYMKAKEVYHKLSLLNPAKSAYFAAKSENLKDK